MGYRFYRRHLPHWQPDAAVLFITFRVIGSLPQAALERIASYRDQLNRTAEQAAQQTDKVLYRKQLFGFVDRELDGTCSTKHASCILTRPEAATVLTECIYKGAELKRFLLHRYCIMPNHVHVLLEPLPKVVPEGIAIAPRWPAATTELLDATPPDEPLEFWPVEELMGGMKGGAARGINKVLHRSGSLFQEENYDHWIRDGVEYGNVIRYIDENPVAAGLCSRAAEWKWSTAAELAKGESCRRG